MNVSPILTCKPISGIQQAQLRNSFRFGYFLRSLSRKQGKLLLYIIYLPNFVVVGGRGGGVGVGGGGGVFRRRWLKNFCLILSKIPQNHLAEFDWVATFWRTNIYLGSLRSYQYFRAILKILHLNLKLNNLTSFQWLCEIWLTRLLVLGWPVMGGTLLELRWLCCNWVD